MDGFHVQNVQYLYEDQDLRNETLIPGKTGNAYDDFDHTQTRNHPENAKLLQSWKHVLDTFIPKTCRERALVVTTGNDIDAAMKYLDAGVNIVRVNLMSGNGTSLAEHIETILNQLDDDAACKIIGWIVGINHIHISNTVHLCKVAHNYYQMHGLNVKKVTRNIFIFSTVIKIPVV